MMKAMDEKELLKPMMVPKWITQNVRNHKSATGDGDDGTTVSLSSAVAVALALSPSFSSSTCSASTSSTATTKPTAPSSSSKPSSTTSKPPVLLDPAEYLRRFQLRSEECIGHAYERANCVHLVSSKGVLTMSLAEDVISLFETQLKTLRSYCLQSLSPLSLSLEDLTDPVAAAYHRHHDHALFEEAVLFLLTCLKRVQQNVRPFFLTTLKSCCESANDFFRMSEKMDRLLQQQQAQTQQQRDDDDNNNNNNHGLFDISETVTQSWLEYIHILSRDAVVAAERTQVFILQAIHHQTSIPSALFSVEWEEQWTHNEVAMQFVHVMGGFMQDIRRFLGGGSESGNGNNDFLFNKALVAACKATVCFYLRSLVEKADAARRYRGRRLERIRNRSRILLQLGYGGNHHKNKNNNKRNQSERATFQHPSQALIRIRNDVDVFKSYFMDQTRTNAALTRIVSNELYILELINECLDASNEDLWESFIVVIHKRTGADALVTHHLLCDLFLLMDYDGRHQHLLKKQHASTNGGGGGGGSLQQDLQMVSQVMTERSRQSSDSCQVGSDNNNRSLINVEQMLRALYEDRIAQGMLPLCWTWLPKDEAEDGASEVVCAHVRSVTRSIAEKHNKF